MLGYPSGIRGDDMVEVVNHLKLTRGVPNEIKVDNGQKIVSKDLGKWAYDNEVELDFSRPAKTTDNAII